MNEIDTRRKQEENESVVRKHLFTIIVTGHKMHELLTLELPLLTYYYFFLK
jgi:hypothetical protein